MKVIKRLFAIGMMSKWVLTNLSGAMNIVRLPDCKTQPAPEVCRDFVFELFGCWPEDGQATPKVKPRSPTETDSSCDEHPFTLVHRPRNPFADPPEAVSTDSEVSTSEDEDFTLVFRPKQKQQAYGYASRPLLQPKRPRRFDPSTPCGPASSYPQKVVRGFEPISQQTTAKTSTTTTTPPPAQQDWVDNESSSSHSVLARPACLEERRRDPYPATEFAVLNMNDLDSDEILTEPVAAPSSNGGDLVLVSRPKQGVDEAISDSEWSMVE